MRLLIAGGAGYMGSTLIPKLLERGYHVDVVDLFWSGNFLPPDVGILHKDIFHLETHDLEPYDQIIFLAGFSNDPMAEYSPAKNFVFNAAAPAYLAYIAKRAKVKRYVYASSCSVCGDTEKAESGILWNDPEIGIEWPLPISECQLSGKDNNAQTFRQWLDSPRSDNFRYQPAS